MRRAVYRLLRSILSRKEIALDYAVISTNTVAESLNIDQTGSAYDYSEVLLKLTEIKPEIWTDLYSAKKPVSKGLRQFLSKGSQGGPPEYWTNVQQMFHELPSAIKMPSLPGDGQQLSTAKGLLEALHNGVLKEPRTNTFNAWESYIAIAVIIADSLSEIEDRLELLKAMVMPLFGQYLIPKETDTCWSIVPATTGLRILVRTFLFVVPLYDNQLETDLQHFSETLAEHTRTSHPEQSKDYAKSQDKVAAEGKRWFTLVGEIDKHMAKRALTQASVSLLTCAMDVLKARNGKPYGAAATIEAAVTLVPSLFKDNPGLLDDITRLMTDDIPSLLLSPSSQQLIATVCAFKGQQGFEAARDALLQALFEAPESSARDAAFRTVIKSSRLRGSSYETKMDDMIIQHLRRALEGDPQSWTLVIEALDSSFIPFTFADRILSTLTESLWVDAQILPALQGLGLVIKHHPGGVKEFATTAEGSKLISRLLFLTESPQDGVANQAVTISTAVESVLVSDSGLNNYVRSSKIELINRELNEAGPDSLS